MIRASNTVDTDARSPIFEYVDRFTDSIIAELGDDVCGALLCGSYVAGTQTALSDVDIQVLLRTPRQQRRLEWNAGVRFDIFLRNVDLIRWLIPRELPVALMFRDGAILYDVDGTTAVLQSLARDCLHAPWRSLPAETIAQMRFAHEETFRKIDAIVDSDPLTVRYTFYALINAVVSTYFSLRQAVQGKATSTLTNLKALDEEAYELLLQSLDERSTLRNRIRALAELDRRAFCEVSSESRIRPPGWRTPWIPLEGRDLATSMPFENGL